MTEPSRDAMFAELRKIDTPTITNVVAGYPADRRLCLGLYNPWTENWYTDSSIRCAYPDIGPVVAQSIYNWFHNNDNLGLLNRLESVNIKLKKTAASKQSLAGKTFVLTGVLEKFSRDEAKSRLRALGGDISSSVSKNTDFVVAGNEPGSKYDKAVKLGVKIINEQEFLKILK